MNFTIQNSIQILEPTGLIRLRHLFQKRREKETVLIWRGAGGQGSLREG